MSTLKERLVIAQQVAEAMGKSIYNNVEHEFKEVTPRIWTFSRRARSS